MNYDDIMTLFCLFFQLFSGVFQCKHFTRNLWKMGYSKCRRHISIKYKFCLLSITSASLKRRMKRTKKFKAVQLWVPKRGNCLSLLPCSLALRN